MPAGGGDELVHYLLLVRLVSRRLSIAGGCKLVPPFVSHTIQASWYEPRRTGEGRRVRILMASLPSQQKHYPHNLRCKMKRGFDFMLEMVYIACVKENHVKTPTEPEPSPEAQAVLDRAELSSLLPRKRLSLENNLGQDDEQDE